MAEKAPAHPLHEAVEAFLLAKRVGGCTTATLRAYRWWLNRFLAAVPELTPLAVRTFFARLQERELSASRQHQAYRTLRTFFRWSADAELLHENPFRGFAMRTPKTLPQVPTEEELQAVLAACPDTLEGTRNRALLLVLADAGLRASEALHLLIEDWRRADRGLFIRAGRGRPDAAPAAAWIRPHVQAQGRAPRRGGETPRPQQYHHDKQTLRALGRE